MTDLYIVAARRTPQGRFLGSLRKRTPVELACAAVNAALEGFPRDRIDQVIFGNVLSAGHGMNIARQIGVKCELPITTPAYAVNMMCASGMQAVMPACRQSLPVRHDILCRCRMSRSTSRHDCDWTTSNYRNAEALQIVRRLALFMVFSCVV